MFSHSQSTSPPLLHNPITPPNLPTPHSPIPNSYSLIPPLLQYHVLVFILALTAVLGRVISIEAVSLVWWRTAIAASAMTLWLAVTDPSRLRLPPRLVTPVLGVGALQCAHWICFFWSIKLSNVSIALAAFATISLFTAFSEPLLERRPLRGAEILCGAIVLVGMLLIAGRLDGNNLAGFLIGLLGSLLHAVFPVFNRRLVSRGYPSRTLFLYEMAGGFLLATALTPSLPPHHFQVPLPADWMPLLVLALLCTLVAHTWNIHLLRRLTAYTANLTMNFEPVWGILLGAVLFAEYQQVGPGFYLGAALIVSANFLDPILRSPANRVPS